MTAEGAERTTGAARSGGRAAFFDVDETLITRKSMLSFLRAYYGWIGCPEAEAEEAVSALKDTAAGPGGRAASNRAYYRLFAGQRVADVAAAGQRWFDDGLRAGGLFHQPVLRALRRHRANGDLIVLVSGSFSACLDPVAGHVDADVALGTVPETSGGRYTGEVRQVRIGAGKAAAVTEVLRDRGLRAGECHAYGDHASDLDLLSQVGHPVVVGEDPTLLERARVKGWRRLPGISSATPPGPSGVADGTRSEHGISGR
ncbi:HAD-IB family hydrolase [Streptomyces sp. NPDC047108]|uniref:HAD family hydrolase n=1 Tax=Streptomyces sp. NPDC047108 TaxID=3155025 RepID=UPI0034034952